MIGFIDSGIGGLTVLKEALAILPEEDYIYYADTANVPYGSKTPHEVTSYILKAVEYLIQYKIKLLTVACNTATSTTIQHLRESFDFPIIGMEPAVKPAVENNNKPVLVMATPLTLREEKFQNLVARVDQKGLVDYLPMPDLVDFAEELTFEGAALEAYICDKVATVDIDRYSTLVLGCTHFIYFKALLKKMLPEDITIIDGNQGTVNHMKNTLSTISPSPGKGNVELYFSSHGEEIIKKNQWAYDFINSN